MITWLYLQVATRGAVLYFVLADLASVDVMYQYSLLWFQAMFTTTIQSTAAAPPPPSPHTGPSLGRRDLHSPDFTQSEVMNSEENLHKHLQVWQ